MINISNLSDTNADADADAVEPTPDINTQRQELFNVIYSNVKKEITLDNIRVLATHNGNTQASERTSITLVKNVLDKLGLSYTEAGSQQSKDFRNIGGIGLDIEVKKTDGYTVTFNDTCPTADIWYLILFTGKENTRTSIPPCVIGINGAVFIRDSAWVTDYQREIDAIKDKYCRGDGKKQLSGIMSVYVRPTYRANISTLLEEHKK